MTATLPPVPNPPFPVYGLSNTFTGKRTVDVWNRLGDGVTGPMWYVALTHTDELGNFATVITDGKLTAGASRQHSALEDVATIALLGIGSTAGTDQDQSLRPADVRRLAEEVGAPSWRPENLTVEGQSRSFWTYRVGDHIAGCADLDTVVIGFHGLHADQLLNAHLEPVNDTLERYALPQIS
jgi:hypothetical protein